MIQVPKMTANERDENLPKEKKIIFLILRTGFLDKYYKKFYIYI